MNQQLMTDALIRRQIFLGRYANGTNRRAQKELTSVLKAIEERIAAGNLTRFQREWLIEQFDIVADIAFGEAEVLAPKEADFTARVLNVGGIPSVEALAATDVIAAFNEEKAELISGKKIQKLTPYEMTRVYSEGEADRVLQIFRDGKLSGESNYDISKKINTVVKPQSRHNTNTLVRTLTNQAASVARKDTYELNDIEFEEYVTVLDARTTVTCAKLSGNIYKDGAGVHPPAHYNCRSVRVPWFDGDTFVDDTGQLKAGNQGDEPTYGDWLEKQSKATQVEVLGDDRAELFRSGELKIEQFADDRGVEYTLDELESLYDVTIETA